MRKAAIRTKGRSDPTRLDADGWRKMLTSKVFDSYTSDLRKAIFDFIKHICINKTKFQNNTTSLETYTVSSLVPLDKKSLLQPVGIGKMLCKIEEKVSMIIVKDDVRKT